MTPKRRSTDPEIEQIRDDMSIMKSDIRDMRDAVLGDGKTAGFFTRLSLNEQSLKRLWWFVGVIAVAITGLCGRIIYSNVDTKILNTHVAYESEKEIY